MQQTRPPRVIDPVEAIPLAERAVAKSFLSNMYDISPSFAREASQLLHDGYIQRAMELCVAGTAKFPNYVTGFLLLGKCCDGLGKTAGALTAYRRALSLLQGHPILQELVRQTEAKESRESTARDDGERRNAGAATVGSESGTQPRPRTEEQTRAVVDQQSALEQDLTKPGPAPASSLHQTLAQEHVTTESPFDYLTRRLQNVRRIKPSPSASPEEANSGAGRSINFVTPTMAEIFVGQGEYKEAINAYRELIRQNPLEEKYRKRLGEVEQLLMVQDRETG